MKKRVRYITAFLLVLAMTVCGSYAFAGTTAKTSDDGVQAALDVTAEGPAEDAVAPENAVAPEEVAAMSEAEASVEMEEPGVVKAMAADPASITAKTLTYSTTEKPEWRGYYKYDASKDYELFYPIAVVKVNSSGKLWFNVRTSKNNTDMAKVVVGKYDKNAGTIDYSYTNWFFGGPDSAEYGLGGLNVSSGGTYYIGVASYGDGSVIVQPYVYSYATRTLPEGKNMLTEGYRTTSDGYNKPVTALYKIKAARTGYIKVSLKQYGFSSSSGEVTLLSAKKGVISDKLWYYSSDAYSAVFGVRKGVTYYLKVSDCYGTSKNGYVYRIKYSNYSAPYRTNTTKSKSKTLTRKASYIYTAMPATGSSGNQWYAFKVTEKRATQLKVDATKIKSGTTTATVYCGSKQVGTTTLTNGAVNYINITYSTTYGQAQKGSYYVKIHKSWKASGKYGIKHSK